MPVTYAGATFQNPTPKVSVNKEFIKAGDGTIIGYTYNITLSGDIISTGALTTPGAGQSNLMGRLRTTFTVDKIGALEVTSYGGGGGFTFPSARVTSVEIPEPSDESMWVQDAQYSITCEADYEGSDSTFSYQIQDASESWSLEEDEGSMGFDVTSEIPYKTYRLTHTAEATGRRKLTSGAVTNDAWMEAELYVKTLCADAPANVNISEMPGGTSALEVQRMGTITAASINADALGAFNHVRVMSVDKANGSFSITDTWTLSQEKATQNLEISVEESATEGDFSITVDGTITGLATEAASDLLHIRSSAYGNAFSALPSDGDLYTLADALYTGGGALLPAPLNKRVGHNKVAGIITYGLAFTDRLPPLIPGSLSTTINVEYINADALEEIFASIPVIGRTDGPVLQDMGTTGEQKRRVSIEAVMEKTSRTNPPAAAALLIAEAYKPTGTIVLRGPINETWEPSSGRYSFNVEWTYQ
jgi:hypothetical protein